MYLLIRSLNGVDARAINTTVTSLPTSDISATILADSVDATASSQRCSDIDKCRTEYDILLSSLVTILACAWFAVHRNIPAPTPKRPPHRNRFLSWTECVWRPVLDQKESALVFLVALVAPELILGWAVRQRIRAEGLVGELWEARKKATEARTGGAEFEVEIAKRVEGFEGSTAEFGGSTAEFDGSTAQVEKFQLINRRPTSPPAHVTCDKCEGAAAERRVAKGNERWTPGPSHGFLVAMGGFLFYDEDGPLYPLSPANVLELVARGHLVPPTEEEISDRSKGDWLTKGVAIGQTVWFVVQCIARRAEGLSVTLLEVMTIAYTVVTVAMYIVWWSKPLNVSCAIRVPKEQVAEPEVKTCDSRWGWIGIYLMGCQDAYVDLRQCKGVPTTWAGNSDQDSAILTDVFLIVVAMAFGAVHCAAWHSDFRSHLEQQLWRLSAITIIVFPLALVVASLVASMIDAMPDTDSASISTDRTPPFAPIGVLFTPLFAVYITARFILIILSFTSLRGLPFDAYQTVQWTAFIPHI